MKRLVTALLILSMVAGLAFANGQQEAAAQETVEIEFVQWWEPELPDGFFRGLMDEFEAQNPGIKVKLVSGPYANTREQIITGAAAGVLSDVVGLDGAWVNTLAKQGAIAPMDPFFDQAGFNKDEMAAIIKLNGNSYMFPVASFVYPIFVNLDLLKEAGINDAPKTREEFFTAAKAVTKEDKNQYGYVLPLSLQSPNGVKNDVMSWVWANGGSMMDSNGNPDLLNSEVVSGFSFIKSLWDAGVVSPGSFSKHEQDKVEEFVTGRTAMMVDTLAHINMIRERNPNLNFTISSFPAAAGYNGSRGLPYAAWGVGVSESSKHKEEAWKLVTFLMSKEINSRIVSKANAFPGNVTAKPDFIESDALLKKGYEIFKSCYLANEFTGLPVAVELMRILDEETQLMLDGEQSVEDALKNAEAKWAPEFK